MLHITKFYQPGCFPCEMLDIELEKLQLDHTFSLPFVIHRVDITTDYLWKDCYNIKKVPLLIFEDIPDFVHGPNNTQIPYDYLPHPTNTHSTIIGALNGYQPKEAIEAYISEIILMPKEDPLTRAAQEAMKHKSKFGTTRKKKK